MKTTDDLSPILDDFFGVGPDVAPDRILVAALDDIERVRQVRRWPLPLAWPASHRPRLLAVAAVLALALPLAVGVGSRLLPPPVEPSPAVSPPVTPSASPPAPPSASPSASPSTTAVASESPSAGPSAAASGPQVLGIGTADPGLWSVPEFDPPFVFGVDRQWSICSRDCDRWANFYIYHPGSGGGASTGIAFARFAQIYGDPCASSGLKAPPYKTPKAFFTWLKTVPNLDLGAASAATVGGFPALQADVTVTSTAACARQGVMTLGVSADGSPFHAGTGDRDRVYAIDVRGKLVTVWLVTTEPDFGVDLTEFAKLLETIQFP